jgi:tetratricopeptide (TPR) repeat protein
MILDDLTHSRSGQIKTKITVTRHRSVVVLLIVLGVGSMAAQVGPTPAEQAEQLRQAGLAHAASGQIDQAIASFMRGLEIAPQDTRLLDAVGAAYSLKGDLETARQYFVQSLKLAPNAVSTRQNLGIALFGLGRYEEASKQFVDLYEIAGKPREVASLFLGLIAQKQSRCKQAVSLIEASGSLLYQYPDALLSYAECEHQLGNAKRAREAVTAFDKLPGKTSTQVHQAAELKARLRINSKAQEEPGKAPASDANEAAAILMRVRRLEDENLLDQAQKILESVTASHATFDVLIELANVAKERGDLATAMKSLKRGSQIEPGREESYLEFSTICADHGNDQLAFDSAEIGLDHVPNSYRLTVQKGAVQEKLGHLSDAEETLRKAIGMQRDNSVAMLSLAVVQAHSGRPDEAEQTLVTAIRQFPDNYYMYYFQGKLLMQFGAAKPGGSDMKDAAKRSFEESIRLNPDYADSYYQLSDLYIADSPELAEQALQKCLKLDPDHIPAQYSLARLYLRTGRQKQGEALLVHFKVQQRSEELQEQRQLRIDAAEN